MESQAPLFWQERYAGVQSSRSRLIGVTQNGCFVWGASEQDLRTWIVIDDRDRVLRSPCRATFGGIWGRTSDTFVEDSNQLVGELLGQLRSRDLFIYLAPSCLPGFWSDTQEELFVRAGARLAHVDLNYSIAVHDWSHYDLSKGNKKKLRQWNENGGQVFSAPRSSLPSAYEIIRENRAGLGVVPSISLDDLARLFDEFPDRYQIHFAMVDGSSAAAAITVNIDRQIKYVFFWADSRTWRHLSPVVALCEYLVGLCRSEGRSILDLGISTELGVRNEGLMRFKSNLGATESRKVFLHIGDAPK